MVAPVTEEAKAAMLANFDLDARKEKLRAMCEAQCASLQSRLERRVNRVPATKRQMPLIELLAPPPPPAKAAPVPVKAAPAKKTAASALAPVPARKTRAAPAATTTSRPATAKEAPKPAPKPAPKHAYSKSAPKVSTMTRGKKRSSDEIASEDKENASADLAVPKKRARAATTTTTKQLAASKPAAPAARSTRAASRKTAPAEVLSPKNNNSRAKPATRSVRPR
ncbi:uncharacterized protein EKO05_0001999 [Ascochyta rabiei]|uniref:uncharacterized protein n=1 Tax=Didymella rabiei TaxID=5454 RepID=UPI0021FA0BE7|nr:uncharacterized protein EKO05_0001999 [Ascochyta rabiei]UPX11393.1 hypothetical protein EKO05_0001999 [Ascochyta rabiei]